MSKYLRSGWLPAAGVVAALALLTSVIAVTLVGNRAGIVAKAHTGSAAVKRVASEDVVPKVDPTPSPETTGKPAAAKAPSAAKPAAHATAAAAAASTASAPSVRAASAGSVVPSKRSLDAYRGLGCWVDLYEDKAFANPTAAVNDMAANGVKTLFIETSNSRMPSAIMHSAQLGTFIRVAHARGIKVVAWYLPTLTNVSVDKDRVAQAIRFRTTDGQRFDSFAMDIEATDVGNVSARNQRLHDLSAATRRVAGPSYPLGAIIPSPIDIKNGFWDFPFPYQDIAKTYDVFVPMSYYTVRTHGGGNWYSRTMADVRTLRSQPGLSNTPIHLIGGLAENSTPSEVRALVRGINDSGLIGGSLYSYSGTKPTQWQQLKAIVR